MYFNKRIFLHISVFGVRGGGRVIQYKYVIKSGFFALTRVAMETMDQTMIIDMTSSGALTFTRKG